MKHTTEEKKQGEAPKRRKKTVVKVLIAVAVVLALALLGGLIATGAAWGWGPFAFLRVRPVCASEQPYKFESSTVYCQNGANRIYGTLYVPKDGKETRGIVILSHGMNGTSDGNAYLAKSFAKSGIAVYAFDFCGGSLMGKSDGDSRNMSVMTEKSDLNCVIDTVKTWDWVDPNQIVLFGESQGGCVSALTAAERDDIRCMVLFYPGLMKPSSVTEQYASIDDIPEEQTVLSLPVGKNYFADVWGLNAFEIAATYTGNVLLVHGDQDTTVPYEVSEKMHEMYENSELCMIKGGGHGFIREQLKEAVEQTYQFLTENMQ